MALWVKAEKANGKILPCKAAAKDFSEDYARMPERLGSDSMAFRQ